MNNIPNSLDDIIATNQDKVQLAVATQIDLSHLERSIPITNLQGIFEAAFIYKWVIAGLEAPCLFVVGYIMVSENRAIGRHTSKVVAYDPNSNTVLTKSGSHYVINRFIDPDTNPHLLVLISRWINEPPLGQTFDVDAWKA